MRLYALVSPHYPLHLCKSTSHALAEHEFRREMFEPERYGYSVLLIDTVQQLIDLIPNKSYLEKL